MKTPSCLKNTTFTAALLLCLGLTGTSRLLAGADATVPKAPAADAAAKADATGIVAAAPETDQFNNWVDLVMGGQMLHGDTAAFKHANGNSGTVFGGISDMHLEQAVGKGALLSLDGRAIFDDHDYKVKAELSQNDLGYIRGGFTEFRTWYDGNGGYFPLNGKSFSLYDNELALDRGTIWAEAGLRMPNLPEITIHYSHEFRDGQKDSTSWGQSFNTGLTNPGGTGNATNARAFVPSFRDINESRDTITLEGNKTYGNTDINLGGRYEYVNNSDSQYIARYPGAVNQNFITQTDKERSDLFSGHGSTVTRFNENLWLTAAYSYTTIDSNIAGGSRIYGQYYDAPYMAINNSSLTGSGYLNLYGGSSVSDHVTTVNLMWQPIESLIITPSARVEFEDIVSTSEYARTAAANATNTTGLQTPRTYNITSDVLMNVAESLDIRYTGVEDWVFYATAEAEQEDGARKENSNSSFLSKNNPLNLDEDESAVRQKYTVGANWYPLPKLSLAAQYYHEMDKNTNDFNSDSIVVTGNQRMVEQTFNTDDLNFRVTWKPCPKLSLVSRYDFTYTEIASKWGVNPGMSGGNSTTGITLATNESSETTNNILSESITWTPFSRLYLLGCGSYVLNRTETPAYEQISTPVVLNFRSDYWTATFSAGLAFDDKTDLRADYTYYRANDYMNNAVYGMPYGSGATEHTASAVLSRQISKNIKMSLKYAYCNYSDQTYGGNDNYDGHMIYTSLQSRF